MTTTLDDPETIPRLGSTKPRLYIPPLESNLVDNYWQQCWIEPKPGEGYWCGHEHIDGLTCETSWGYDCIDFLTYVMGWELLPYQKWLYIHALEKSDDRKGFRFNILVILIARQNGKTKWLKGLGLWRLFYDEFGRFQQQTSKPGCVILIAAQNLDYAETMLTEVAEEVAEHPELRKEYRGHPTTNGKHRLILTHKRIWRAATAGRRGGRSLSVDLAELDELREHLSWDAWDAIVPTTIARRNSLAVATSNAGDARSVVLRSLKDSSTARIMRGQTAESRIFYAEWSVPMDVDPKNPSYWHMANPAMGYPQTGLDLEGLQAELQAVEFTNMAGFRTEHLCQWVDSLAPGIIPAEHWQETLDAMSARAAGAPVYAAVDVNFKRTKSYISIGSRRPDGHLHIEVVAAARGTDWIVPWFKQRPDKFVAVAVQSRGAPAAELIDPMKAAGIPVMEWGGADVAIGTGRFFEGICQHVIFHRPQPVLDRSAASTVGRNIGDQFVLDRRNSPVDAAPLIACAAATWAESVGPQEEPPPQISGWDDDEVARWEREAAEEDNEWR